MQIDAHAARFSLPPCEISHSPTLGRHANTEPRELLPISQLTANINKISSTTLLTDLKKITGFRGKLLKSFGKALKIMGDQGEIYYLSKRGLAKRIFKAFNFCGPKTDQKKLTTLLTEVLSPVRGEPVAIGKIRHIFERICSSNLFMNPTTQTFKATLSNLKLCHLETIDYDPDALEKVLQVGDIIFKKNNAQSDKIVVTAQNFFKRFNKAELRDREGFKYSHTAMYVGNGEIAESACALDGGIQVRLLKLADSRFALHPEEGEKYVITRSRDASLAERAAKVARSIVMPASPMHEKQTNSHAHKYSYFTAFSSVWHDSTFGIGAKQRYFKQYYDHKHNDMPRTFMKAKDFICSNFVAYCYQAVESQTVVPQIIGDKSGPKKASTPFEKALFRGIWARVKSYQNRQALDRLVKMKYDAKWMTPLDLRNFVVGHPELFTDKLLVRQPA